MKKLTKITLSMVLCSNLLYAIDTSKIEQELKIQAQQMQAKIDERKDIADKKDIDSEKDKTISQLAQDKYSEKKQEWDEKESGISLEIGTWFVSWDQTSTAKNMLSNQNDALNVKYNIDSSLAAVATLSMNYKLISGKVEYYKTAATESQNEEVSGLNAGLSILDLVPHLSAEMRLITADFKGGIEATESDGTVSTYQPTDGNFETKLHIWDFIVYPFQDSIGIGYRKYNYEVPLDFYLTDNSNDTAVKIDVDGDGIIDTIGLIDVELDGNFITLVADNKRLLDKRTSYNGIIYSIIAGVGKLDQKAAGFEEWIEKSDAKFIDALLGYKIKYKTDSGVGLGFTAGYRYNKLEIEANKKEGTYSLLTEFNTEFHGPYINLVLSY